MSTVTALLTNKAYGYPRRGARRRRKPTILACLHQTANAKATAMQERNYANRAGSHRPIGHRVHRPRRDDRARHRPRQVRRLEPGRRRASEHEDPDDRRRRRLGREHERVGPRVDRVLGCRAPSPTPTPSSRAVARLVAAASKATGLPINRSTVVVHADINSVSPPQRPVAAGHPGGRVKRVIARANAILRPPSVTVTVKVRATPSARSPPRTG